MFLLSSRESFCRIVLVLAEIWSFSGEIAALTATLHAFGEDIVLGFQHYLVMLGTTVITSTIIVPFMASNMQIDESGPSTAQPLHMQTDEVGLSNAQPLHIQINEAGPSNEQPLYSSDDISKTVVANLNQGSAVKSMDFHSVQQTFILEGTITRDVSVWEVGCGRMLASRNFKVWDMGFCSLQLHASLSNEYSASVTCVKWSPKGNRFGQREKMLHQFLGFEFQEAS